MDHQLDIDFAQPPGDTQADTLRTIAGINYGATREQFLNAAVRAGFKRNSAAARFLESRKASLEMDGDTYKLHADGRLLKKEMP